MSSFTLKSLWSGYPLTSLSCPFNSILSMCDTVSFPFLFCIFRNIPFHRLLLWYLQPAKIFSALSLQILTNNLSFCFPKSLPFLIVVKPHQFEHLHIAPNICCMFVKIISFIIFFSNFLLGDCMWTAIGYHVWCQMWHMVPGDHGYWARWWRSPTSWPASHESTLQNTKVRGLAWGPVPALYLSSSSPWVLSWK